MNAYELADDAKNIHTTIEALEFVQKAVPMLRQQADRIAELEKQGEPVAWMQMHYKDNVPTKFSPVKVWEDDIPLYTTPQTKPLSNDEIDKLLKETKDWYEYARAIEERHGIK